MSVRTQGSSPLAKKGGKTTADFSWKIILFAGILALFSEIMASHKGHADIQEA